jgi:hypothetical protein
MPTEIWRVKAPTKKIMREMRDSVFESDDVEAEVLTGADILLDIVRGAAQLPDGVITDERTAYLAVPYISSLGLERLKNVIPADIDRYLAQK